MDKSKDTIALGMVLSTVTILFLIGLVVFIFAIAGGSVADATRLDNSGSEANESVYFTDGTGTDTSVAGLQDIALSNVVVEGCYYETP